MSLEERLKGARQKRRRDDLLAVPLRERIFRVLEYMIPVATRGRVRAPRARHLPPRHQAGEHPRQAARSEPARLADEGQARRLQRRQGRRRGPRRLDDAVPGACPARSTSRAPSRRRTRSSCSSTCTQGSPEVEFFEDFYIDIYENDTFSLFNRNELYSIAAADRARKKILLDRPFARAERDQRARPRREERRSPGRHLLARRGVLLPDLAARTRTRRTCSTRSASSSSTSARREQHDRRVHRARVPHDPDTCARRRPTARAPRARARGSLLQLQALPRRQRRADRSARS